uniref:desulfoferrodoxin family protein n=1 Tax=Enterocloster clostridioformis TaxID=1531 RepID=UPI0025A52691|nr:desulfoferrodoxin family protein [Enterocloster clostridioformis]
MKNEPVFLTDKNHNIVLEALSPAPNAVLPDSCKPFEILEPTTAEGAAEKHLPVVEQNGLRVTVRVGNTFHPMDQEHSIGWVCLVTKAGCIMRVPLTPDCEPVASFTLEEGDAPAAAYAYCNLHGLWKKSV